MATVHNLLHMFMFHRVLSLFIHYLWWLEMLKNKNKINKQTKKEVNAGCAHTYLTAKCRIAGPGFLGKSCSRTRWSSCSQFSWPLREEAKAKDGMESSAMQCWQSCLETVILTYQARALRAVSNFIEPVCFQASFSHWKSLSRGTCTFEKGPMFKKHSFW